MVKSRKRIVKLFYAVFLVPLDHVTGSCVPVGLARQATSSLTHNGVSLLARLVLFRPGRAQSVGTSSL